MQIQFLENEITNYWYVLWSKVTYPIPGCCVSVANRMQSAVQSSVHPPCTRALWCWCSRVTGERLCEQGAWTPLAHVQSEELLHSPQTPHRLGSLGTASEGGQGTWISDTRLACRRRPSFVCWLEFSRGGGGGRWRRWTWWSWNGSCCGWWSGGG